ncbi:FHA domain-containing protein [Trichocoleus sp. FACHB-591]|uniref:FHA domain-containing protein n=1 Tax=Trichocoleus sp. FACHB-591 TaxID=2692872 RepID=UPI001688A0B0|nr:FHA domain-containing protein [Trichocoleus sp. FACHB-591]MBD2095666.1 FHA domain-containing protein [Trichocoleus sp. FACHB-591]
MLSKSKLLNHLKELNQLAIDGSFQVPLDSLTQSLEHIRSNLELDKLNVYIISADIALAESFQQRFSFYPTLDNTYQFQVHELTKREVEKSKDSPSAFLAFQEQAEITQRYPLSTAPILTVGRQRGCDFYISDRYTRVSGQHLEIRFYPAGDRITPHQWHVKNSDRCRNGTYVNGERLTEERILKSGDRLVLGDRYPSAQSPELVFEHSIVLEPIQHEAHFSLDKFRGCIVFLIVGSKQELSEEEKAVLALACSTPSTNIFLVTSSAQTIEVINGLQQSSASEGVFTELDSLCQQMTLIKTKQITERKTQNAVVQTIAWISSLEEALLTQQQPIAQQVEALEKQRSQNKVRKTLSDKSISQNELQKKISEQRSKLSEIVDTALEQSKQDLLDDSLVNSILYRISDEIDSMEAQIIKPNKKQFLKLVSKNCEDNVNDYLMHFCEEELLDWARTEWERICWHYDDGGVEGLIARSQTLLESISKTSSRYFTPVLCQEIEMQTVFRVSLKKISDRVEYQPVSIWSFSIKKIRSSVFQVMSILFLLSFLGLSRGSFIRGVVKQITSSNFLILLAIGIVIWLISKLCQSYQNDKQAEIRKVSDKIRLDLKGYYQKVIKSRFAEKLTRILKTTFKEEMNRFEKELRLYFDAVQSQSENSTVNRVNFELQLKKYKEDTKKLEDKLKNLYSIRDKVHRMLEG